MGIHLTPEFVFFRIAEKKWIEKCYNLTLVYRFRARFESTSGSSEALRRRGRSRLLGQCGRRAASSERTFLLVSLLLAGRANGGCSSAQ